MPQGGTAAISPQNDERRNNKLIYLAAAAVVLGVGIFGVSRLGRPAASDAKRSAETTGAATASNPGNSAGGGNPIGANRDTVPGEPIATLPERTQPTPTKALPDVFASAALPRPEFEPLPGTYSSVQSVVITDAASGAVIRYTANGSAPNAKSTKYTGPIKVSATSTIRAIALDEGHGNSQESSATYTIDAPQNQSPPSVSSVGRWKGTYTRCEDGSQTAAILDFHEQADGKVSGSLALKAPTASLDICSLAGTIFVDPTDHKRHLRYSVGRCDKGAPVWLQGSHTTLLDFEGGRLGGTVEPQDTCEVVEFKRQ
jgi:hypothetical protein